MAHDLADPLAWALSALPARWSRYHDYNAYYDGTSPYPFPDEKYRKAFGRLLQEARINLCARIVDAHVEHLSVEAFANPDGTEGEQDDLEAAAWRVWEDSGMDLREGEVYHDVFRLGDGYATVWPHELPTGQIVARITPERPETITVHYDTERPGLITAAAKAWKPEDDRWRLTLYFPDRIEKYVARQARKDSVLPKDPLAFEQRAVEGEAWPLLNPYGRVPVFHYANNARLGGFGRSELANLMSPQDALNKTEIDMLTVGEQQTFKQRWATGIAGFIDAETGEEVAPFVPGADRVWTSPTADARFGEFSEADMRQFLDQKEAKKTDMAQIAAIPPHYLMMTGTPPSGEMLKTAESPWVKKLSYRSRSIGATHADVLAFALSIEGQPGARLKTVWEGIGSRSEREAWDIAVLKLQAGVSPDQVQKENGYSEDQIARMKLEAGAAMQARGAVIPEEF